MSFNENYQQTKERLGCELLRVIAEDITRVAPILLDFRGLQDSYRNTKREIYYRHCVEEGLDCPGALSHGTVLYETATLMWQWYCKESKEAGVPCPTEPLKEECLTLLTEPDEGWAAYLAERAEEQAAQEARMEEIRASRPRIKVEEEEEITLADIPRHPPNPAPAEPEHLAPAADLHPAVKHLDTQDLPKNGYQDLLAFLCRRHNLALQWLFVPTSKPGTYRYNVLVGGKLFVSSGTEDHEHSAREAVAVKALADVGLFGRDALRFG